MSNAHRGTIWYISKYLLKPQDCSSGGRGFYLIQELAAIGYDCLIITSNSNHLHPTPEFQESTFHEQLNGVSIIWINTLKYAGAKSIKRILSWFDFDFKLTLNLGKFGAPPDVVIASSLSLTSVLVGIFLKLRYKSRLIFEVRDIWPLTLTEEGGFSKHNPFVKFLSVIERLGYKQADAVVGTMANLEPHVRIVSKSTKPVFCVPMGVASEDIKPATQTKLPIEYLNAKVPKGKFLVGYAGSIGVTNALEVIFEAATMLVEENDVHFVIVGRGDMLPTFKAKYSNLQNLTFVDSVPKEFVQSVLSEFDLLTLSTYPSKIWEYGLSLNKLIDYMLAAKPIVASYTGFQSMLSEAKCGVFVPAGDVNALVNEIQMMRDLDKESLTEMGARGRDWVIANRNYSKLAASYEKILFPHENKKNLAD